MDCITHLLGAPISHDQPLGQSVVAQSYLSIVQQGTVEVEDQRKLLVPRFMNLMSRLPTHGGEMI